MNTSVKQLKIEDRLKSDPRPRSGWGRYIVLVLALVPVIVFYYIAVYGFATANAAASGDLATVKKNVRWNPRLLHARPDGWTLLNYAAASGRIEVVQFLIAEGADIDAANEWGMTSLELATQNGHSEVADLLVEKGAKMESALHEAIRNGGYRKILYDSLHKYYVNNIEYETGNTPLMTAAEVGNVELTMAFIQVDSNPGRLNKSGENALDLANRKGHDEVVSFLLSSGKFESIAN